ncbi:MAG: serine hydrolase, partial [Bacteroidota bacterium]
MKTFTLLLLMAISSLAFGQELYFPPLDSEEWDTLPPSELNFCPEKIEDLYNYLEAEETLSFILLKDGKIVLEQYFNDHAIDDRWVWFSAGKSLRATLVGIAQEEGYLNIEDKTSDYLGVGWTSLPQAQEDSITIWHQLTMTTGLDESDFSCSEPACLNYKAPAGTRWFYHNAPYNLLKDVLENTTGQSLNAYTNLSIRNKIGMQTGTWVPFGDNTFFFSTARDMARFGLMIQNKGTWDNTPVLADQNYYEAMARPSQGLNPAYGYLWWLNGQDSYIPPGTALSFAGPLAPDSPLDVFSAAGGQGQFISISPERGWLMIRQGMQEDTDLTAIPLLNEIWKRILDLECTPVSSQEATPYSIELSPNPTEGWLHINDPSSRLERMQLYNLDRKPRLNSSHYLQS